MAEIDELFESYQDIPVAFPKAAIVVIDALCHIIKKDRSKIIEALTAHAFSSLFEQVGEGFSSALVLIGTNPEILEDSRLREALEKIRTTVEWDV